MGYHIDYSILRDDYYLRRLIGGLETTLILFIVCLFASLLIGIILAGIRSAPIKPGQVAVAAFVEYQRNVPLLVHLLVWYFGVASILPNAVGDFANRHGAEFTFAAIALSLYGGAFISEDLRSGLRAIPKTQYESARSIGLSFAETLWLVILPQAVRHAFPPIVNQVLSLYKNTSVAAVIGVAELMYRSREIATETFRVFEIFSIATVVYFIGSVVLIGGGHACNRWLQIPGSASR
ncbi:amino acid ABC transporter permease [Mesorhizobium sp. BR1-1-2]|uniref:amino acid ABC transporter permease n=1 Tax=Mesorhizobium sp. BR1-1-2 TaxID=2876652 RepID=UPI001CCC57C2|nr:amino acid ABC transporter permease [Mesorhizobium sp. BR1-1-2]MBZ9965865.1 amino acid ABC transporter permease [Mesorhizobium sp. BR1-1-2]